jgi:hypothetical protein
MTSNFTIYYTTNDSFCKFIGGDVKPTIDQITIAENPNHDTQLTHACVGVISAKDLNQVHYKMNMVGENMNDAEWNEFEKDMTEMNVGHASMSVGDVAYCHKTETYFLVERFGWLDLTNFIG